MDRSLDHPLRVIKTEAKSWKWKLRKTLISWISYCHDGFYWYFLPLPAAFKYRQYCSRTLFTIASISDLAKAWPWAAYEESPEWSEVQATSNSVVCVSVLCFSESFLFQLIWECFHWESHSFLLSGTQKQVLRDSSTLTSLVVPLIILHLRWKVPDDSCHSKAWSWSSCQRSIQMVIVRWWVRQNCLSEHWENSAWLWEYLEQWIRTGGQSGNCWISCTERIDEWDESWIEWVFCEGVGDELETSCEVQNPRAPPDCLWLSGRRWEGSFESRLVELMSDL